MARTGLEGENVGREGSQKEKMHFLKKKNKT